MKHKQHTIAAQRLVLLSFVSLPGMALGATRINVGDNFQAVVNANPSETVFIIASGTHRQQRVWPNNGTSFIGENGAIMKGSKLLEPAAAVQNGSLYYWTGQTQEEHSQNAYGVDSGPNYAGHERETYYANELFVDGVRYRHVNSLSLVDAPNEWFFDYDTDRIYMYGSPVGHTIETSTTPKAFDLNGKSNIRIENLTIAQYANSMRAVGPIEGIGCQNLILRNVESSYNHAAGAGVGPNAIVENCKFTYNGQIGLVGSGQIGTTSDPTLRRPIYLRNNEFAFNKQLSFVDDETGTFKIARTNGGIFEHNWGHDNKAWGMWWDVYNQGNIIRSNLVEGGTTNRGIFYEISGNVDAAPTQIYWNTIKNQGDVGIDISNSAHCWVFENAISQPDWFGGIRGRDNGRSPDAVDTTRRFAKYRAWGNDIKARLDIQHAVQGVPSQVEYIQGNTYRGANRFNYFSTTTNFATWQSKGYDTNGTYTATLTEPSLPSWAKPFQPSHYGTLPDSRVAHWRLDENTGTVASNSATNSYHGTVSGNATWLPIGGQRDGALDLEQDSPTPNTAYVDSGTVAGSSPALTVAFWMKAEQADRHMIPISKFSGDSSGPNMTKGWAIKLRNDGDVRFRVGGEYSSTSISSGAGTYGTNWMHVAATFTGGTAKLYINGVLTASQSGITTHSVDNTTAPLRFGKNSAGVIEPYDGLLDDVQIYSTALDQVQIQGIMGTTTGLRPVGNWHLDEAGGNTATDDSGNNNTGTLVSSPIWSGAKQGYGLDLPGVNKYVSIPDSPSLSINGSELTLMAWIKADAVNDYRAIVSKNNTAYELDLHNGKLYTELRMSDGTLMRAETSNVEITTGNFYHVALVRSGTSIKFYVNGVSKPVTFLTTAKSNPLATNTSALNIGRRPVSSMYFDGIIDEVEVHNTALAASEVAFAMNN